MKRLIFIQIILLSLSVNQLFAQSFVKYGVVRELNSGSRPISNVQITYLGAPSVITDNLGQFKIIFPSKKNGDVIFLADIIKSGYEVVNKKEIEQIILYDSDTTPIKIILAREGQIEEERSKYYNASIKHLNNQYEKKMEYLKLTLQKDQQIMSQIDLREKQIEIQQYQKRIYDLKNKIASLQEEIARQNKQLDFLSDKFARTDLDIASKSYKNALLAFQEGNINKSLSILNDSIIDTLVLHHPSTKNNGFSSAKPMEDLIKSMLLKAQLYGLEYNWEKVNETFLALYKIDSSDLQILESYSFYLVKQGNFNEGMAITKKLLRKIDEIYEYEEVNKSKVNILSIYNQSGTLFASIGKYQEAKQSFDMALKVWALKNPDSVIMAQLDTILLKGSLNSDKYHILKESYITQIKDKAIILNNLGNLYLENNERYESIKCYTNALALLEDLQRVDTSNNSFKIELADTYSGLGSILIDFSTDNEDAYQTASDYLQNSIRIYKELNTKFPENDEIIYMEAICLNNLAALSEKIDSFTLAESFYNQSLLIITQLYNRNAYKYRIELMRGYLAIALLNNKLWQIDKNNNVAFQKYNYNYKKAQDLLEIDESSLNTDLPIKKVLEKLKPH